LCQAVCAVIEDGTSNFSIGELLGVGLRLSSISSNSLPFDMCGISAVVVVVYKTELSR
jgi:hypothetical protein